MTRKFEISAAVRTRVPLLVGLVGPSSSGKTFSALRLATGMARVTGGKIVCIDTESRRALHYAGAPFAFEHMPFEAPFGPLDYLSALEAAAASGATIAIIDSASHEWEGPGGVLEMHDAKAEELAKKWNVSLASVNLTAWADPKSQHRRLVNSAMQLPLHTIWCFRAKEKLKITKGKDPSPLGWMPIASDDLIYEMTVNALLPPGSGGVPDWKPREPGSQQIVKLPGWAAELFPAGRALDEQTGESLARWAEGTVPVDVGTLCEQLASATTQAAYASAEKAAKAAWRTLSKPDQARVKGEIDAAKTRLSAEAAAAS